MAGGEKKWRQQFWLNQTLSQEETPLSIKVTLPKELSSSPQETQQIIRLQEREKESVRRNEKESVNRKEKESVKRKKESVKRKENESIKRNKESVK